MLGGLYTLKSAGVRLAGVGTQVRVQHTKRTASHSRAGACAASSSVFARVPQRLREGGWFLLAVAVWCISGCAGMAPGVTKDTPPAERQKVVAERAEARWKALIKGDLEDAYSYLSPGSRATTSFALYKAKVKPGMWRDAKAEKVTCDGDLCQVTMLVTYDAKRMKGIETPVMESWVIENGTPWYVYR